MSIGIDVSSATLDDIRADLRAGASDLEACTGAPASVDGGVMSAFLNQILVQLSSSAGAVSEALSVAADGVGSSAETYWNADDAARENLTMPGPTP